jgi:hypothetical protein
MKNKVYDYRVAMVVSNNHLKPDGGIGTSVQSSVQMFQTLGARVDLIMDIEPTNDVIRSNFISWFKNNDCKVITSNNRSGYKFYREFSGKRNVINFDETINFRDSIYRALQKNIYDLFVVHSTQAGVSLYAFDIADKVPSVMYTHDYNTVFTNASRSRLNDTLSLAAYNDMVHKLPNYIIGTHTERNVKQINHSTALCLPLPLTAKDLLIPLTQEEKDKQNGVLFVGRWESNQNPLAYCDLIAKTKLPARLLVSSDFSIDKWKKEFKARGIKDYEFAKDRYPEAKKRGFTNQKEKSKFIKSCKVSFLPYVREAYGLAQYEALTSMPSVVYAHNIWHKNFAQFPHLYKETEKTAPQRVLDLHNDPTHKSAQQEIIAYEKTVPDNWKMLLDAQLPVTPVKNVTSRMRLHNNFWHNDFISKLKRPMSIEDIRSIYNTQSLFKRYYTATDTWYTQDNTLPTEDDAVISIQDYAKGL